MSRADIAIAIARLYVEMHDVWIADPFWLSLADDGHVDGWGADFGSGEKMSTLHNTSLTHDTRTICTKIAADCG